MTLCADRLVIHAVQTLNVLVVYLVSSGTGLLSGCKALQRADDQPVASEYESFVLVAICDQRVGVAQGTTGASFEPRSRLLLLSLFLHSQPAGPFGRTFTVPVELAVVAVSLVRAAIAQLYSTPLAYLVESLLSSVGSLNT